MKRGRWIACLLPLLAVCRPEAAGAEYAAFAAAVVCGVAVPPGGMTGETEERSGAIDSVTVTARRPLSDIGIQKTVFDETLLHEDVTFSLADMLAHSTPVFIKSYGRGTMATVSLRGTGCFAYARDMERHADELSPVRHDGPFLHPLLLHRRCGAL